MLIFKEFESSHFKNNIRKMTGINTLASLSLKKAFFNKSNLSVKLIVHFSADVVIEDPKLEGPEFFFVVVLAVQSQMTLLPLLGPLAKIMRKK